MLMILLYNCTVHTRINLVKSNGSVWLVMISNILISSCSHVTLYIEYEEFLSNISQEVTFGGGDGPVMNNNIKLP